MSELIIERHFPSSPDKVFEFVSKQEHLLKWWGPEGMTIAENQLDFSKPGRWSSTMINADGKRYKVSGEVIVVNNPNSLEITWGWHDENDERGHNSIVRFEVNDDGSGGTHFKLIHRNLPDEESVQNHSIGWTSSFVKLERLNA